MCPSHANAYVVLYNTYSVPPTIKVKTWILVYYPTANRNLQALTYVRSLLSDQNVVVLVVCSTL